mmetsp:Transcript_2991/g.8344  ORF Transcript_2991/g.8344 Transcript_2991/m.8344 type:complete len:82 (-) Transcript_2991:999-1244(-)
MAAPLEPPHIILCTRGGAHEPCVQPYLKGSPIAFPTPSIVRTGLSIGLGGTYLASFLGWWTRLGGFARALTLPRAAGDVSS